LGMDKNHHGKDYVDPPPIPLIDFNSTYGVVFLPSPRYQVISASSSSVTVVAIIEYK